MNRVQDVTEANFAGFEATQVAKACGVSRQSIENMASKLGIVPNITAGGKQLFSGSDLAKFRNYYESKRQRGEVVAD